MRYFHGGAPGLSQGDTLLPAVTIGVKAVADYMPEQDTSHIRRDRVYITSSFEVAAAYASLQADSQDRAWIYEVIPIGEIEPDPDYIGPEPDESRQCEVGVCSGLESHQHERRDPLARAPGRSDPRGRRAHPAGAVVRLRSGAHRAAIASALRDPDLAPALRGRALCSQRMDPSPSSDQGHARGDATEQAAARSERGTTYRPNGEEETVRHMRTDYDVIQDPGAPGRSRIKDDEPVLLIRGQDLAAPATAHAYAAAAEALGTDPAVCDAVREWAEEITAWQESSGLGKIADVPEGVLR